MDRGTQEYLEFSPEGRAVKVRFTYASAYTVGMVFAPVTLGLSLLLIVSAHRRVNRWRAAACA